MQNSGIISLALNLREEVRSADFSGALKSGTSALLSALEGVGSKSLGQAVLCAADCRLGKMGSPQEMIFGDGGASFLVGDEGVIAEYKGSYSLTCRFRRSLPRFQDHFRPAMGRPLDPGPGVRRVYPQGGRRAAEEM